MPSHRLDTACSTLTVVAAPAAHTAHTGPPLVPGDSEYVEVWVGVLGPSAYLLYRHLVRELRRTNGPVTVAVDDLAASFGIRPPHVLKSLERLVDFDFAEHAGGVLGVRTAVPLVSRRMLQRLGPSALRLHHQLAHLGEGR